MKKILRACRDNFDRLGLPYFQLVKADGTSFPGVGAVQTTM